MQQTAQQPDLSGDRQRGSNIDELLRSAGFTEDQVADGLGVDKAIVRRWCEGTEAPPPYIGAAPQTTGGSAGAASRRITRTLLEGGSRVAPLGRRRLPKNRLRCIDCVHAALRVGRSLGGLGEFRMPRTSVAGKAYIRRELGERAQTLPAIALPGQSVDPAWHVRTWSINSMRGYAAARRRKVPGHLNQ